MEEVRFIQEENGIRAVDGSGNPLGEVVIVECGGGLYNIAHTYVEDAARGMGLASRLVEEAVRVIGEKGGSVTATCSYADHWLRENGTATPGV